MNAKRIISAMLAMLMLITAGIVGVSAEDTLPFTDVPKGEWYYDAVAYTYGTGLMNGTGDGTKFSPTMNLTRGMVVTVLYRNDGSPSVSVSNPFSDISDDAWYATAATWAYNAGVVTGTGFDEWGDPIFSAERNITRQELAAMFARYAAYKHVDTAKNTTDITTFPDGGKVASWAEKEFKWTAGTGIITGKTSGGAATLSPEDLATRAEFAIMIQRYNVKDDAREFTYNLAFETPVIKNSYTEPDYPLVNDADIYVAVDGNDKNDGSFEKPLATFAAAKDAVRKLIAEGKKDEIKVAFKGGDYGVLDNLQFTAEDSGNENVKITYCAYGDDDVYFTNGVYVTEDKFTDLEEDDLKFFNPEFAGDIKKADLSGDPNADKINHFTPLSDSTSFCWLARTPNKEKGIDKYFPGFTKHVLLESSPYKTMDELIEAVEAGVTQSNDEVSTHIDHYKLQTLHTLSDKLASMSSYENIQLIGYIGKVWHQDVLNITGFDKATGIVSTTGPHYSYYAMIESQQQAYLNNVSDELDAVGEYWIDAENKVLYVYKPQGSYTMAVADTFATINKGAEYITFKKLNFRSCSGNAIIANGDHFTFDMGSIMYVGGSYAFLSSDTRFIEFTNSTVAYCAESGVCIEAPRGKNETKYYALENTGCVIRNNLVHDVDMASVPVESGAVRFSNQVGADVSHNEIYNSARYGIDFKYGNVLCIMEYNYLHHCMQNSADGGAFYCGRVATNRGNEIRYNVVSDIYPLNPIHTGGTYAIYLDDNMENLICYGNVFYNSGMIMNNGGRSHEFYDNVFIGKTSGIAGRAPNILDIRVYGSPEADNHYYSEGWNGLDRIPDENTPNGQKWKELWPELYDIVAIRNNPDIDVTKLDLYSDPINYCHNNYHFDGAMSEFADKWVELSDHENNLEIPEGENPIFVDPTHGDYSIRDGVEFMDNHFDMVGRY
ncbi:MAG: S-layer homology domain-containing protein [Clostridia bacterium]|nr:S-layer homology domain-containing protein [Clostridia bacterium]